MTEAPPVIIGYWPIRGLCQPIRLLLEYVGAPYRERHYVTGPAPDYDKRDWLDERDTLGLDFPNLPYLIDGDVRLTETCAILRYLDREHGLLPADDHRAHATADMVACFTRDLAQSFIDVCYADSFEHVARYYVDRTLPRLLGYLERFVGTGWIATDRPTYVDFLVYEIVDQHRMLAPALLDSVPALAAFQTRVASVPPIATFLRSSRCIRWPINNRMAAFGGGDRSAAALTSR